MLGSVPRKARECRSPILICWRMKPRSPAVTVKPLPTGAGLSRAALAATVCRPKTGGGSSADPEAEDREGGGQGTPPAGCGGGKAGQQARRAAAPAGISVPPDKGILPRSQRLGYRIPGPAPTKAVVGVKFPAGVPIRGEEP